MISIIIPALNEAKYIGRCIDSIKVQKYPDYEIIVVDAHSKDNTKEIVRKAGAKVIQQKPCGAGAARNAGAAKARGQILVFVDADTQLPRHWLRYLEMIYVDKKVVAAAGPVKPGSRRLKHKFMFFIMSDMFPKASSFFRFYQFNGANMSVRADVFKKMGGFREGFQMMEDNEIGNHAKRFGKVVWDRSLYAITSTRRFDKNGYWRTTLGFWQGYLEMRSGKKKIKYKDRGG
jgi:glycosyltransferase involved in cell wall biosynthesis